MRYIHEVAEKPLQAIIFDLGGVLIDIDYNVLRDSFARLGLGDFDAQFSKARQQRLFDRYETGEIATPVFRSSLSELIGKPTSDEAIDQAWNAMIFELPAHRLELLQKTRGSYRTFLLSNTNEVHMDFIHEYMTRTHGTPRLDPYFEKVYLSYEMGLRKPDPEIFKRVLEENSLKAESTLFIDDSPQHIQAAASLGIQTYHLDTEREDVTALFR